MTALSTAQVRALTATRDANADNGRGHIPPDGPRARPYKFLVLVGMLTRKPGESLHYITDEGRKALEEVLFVRSAS